MSDNTSTSCQDCKIKFRIIEKLLRLLTDKDAEILRLQRNESNAIVKLTKLKNNRSAVSNMSKQRLPSIMEAAKEEIEVKEEEEAQAEELSD